MAERADVVVGLSTPPILGALAVARAHSMGAKAVYWAMDVYPEIAFALGVLKPASVVGRLSTWLARWTLRNADMVVALGETMAATLRRQGAERIIVVHNWADGNAVQPEDPDQVPALRPARWNGKFIVQYSGNMGLAHEFETLMSAARELSVDPDLRFAFVGSGPRRSEVEAEAIRELQTNVEFLPPVHREQLGQSLAAGDLHVVTMRPGMTGLLVPSKIYGILAAGRPVLYIGPTEGEVYSIVQSFRCGICVRNGDIHGTASAISLYKSQIDLRRDAGRRAREAFERHFTLEAQTAKIIRMLKLLVEEPQLPESIYTRAVG